MACVLSHLQLEGSYLTAPPLSEDTLTMLALGWDWPTLEATPARVVDEMMLYHQVRNEYMAQKAKAAGHGG